MEYLIVYDAIMDSSMKKPRQFIGKYDSFIQASLTLHIYQLADVYPLRDKNFKLFTKWNLFMAKRKAQRNEMNKYIYSLFQKKNLISLIFRYYGGYIQY